MVQRRAAHVVGAGVGGDDHGRDPEAVTGVVAGTVVDGLQPGEAATEQRAEQRAQPPGQVEDVVVRGHVVGWHRLRRRDVVVVAAVLVVEPDQQRVGPRRATHDAVDDLRGEGFAPADVLRVLFGVGLEVRVDDAHRGQPARVRVGEELFGPAQVPDARG